MKLIASFLALLFYSVTVNAQNIKPNISNPDPGKKIQKVELSCGECKFHMKGKSCELAVRINGKAYFLDGADIDSFGDAHGKMGFCNAIRKAEVQGEVVNNRFKASYIKLVTSSKN